MKIVEQNKLELTFVVLVATSALLSNQNHKITFKFIFFEIKFSFELLLCVLINTKILSPKRTILYHNSNIKWQPNFKFLMSLFNPFTLEGHNS